MKRQISPLIFRSPDIQLLPRTLNVHKGDVEEYDDMVDDAANDGANDDDEKNHDHRTLGD